MHYGPRCFCPCHSAEHPDIAATWGVPVNDPVESEAACSQCKTAHMLNKPYLPPEPWTPAKDQADGGE